MRNLTILFSTIALATLTVGCLEEQKTGTSAAALSALTPAIVTCNTEGTSCSVDIEIDEHGHLVNVHDFIDFGAGDTGDDEDQVSYQPVANCPISPKFSKICSRAGKCPKGNAVWCKTKTCTENHGGVDFPVNTQVQCQVCGGGVNPNTSTNGCNPV